MEILRITSAQVKIHQVFVISEIANQFFSNFASFFSVIRHNSSILLKSLKNCTLMAAFYPKHIMFQLENFTGTMCHDTEE